MRLSSSARVCVQPGLKLIDRAMACHRATVVCAVYHPARPYASPTPLPDPLTEMTALVGQQNITHAMQGSVPTCVKARSANAPSWCVRANGLVGGRRYLQQDGQVSEGLNASVRSRRL